MHCPVMAPDIVSVVDATLLDSINISEGATENTVFLINTTKDPKEVREKLAVGPGQKVFTVDATKIALDCFGRAMPNSPMLGALCKVSGLITLDHLLEDVRKSFGKKFAQKVIDGNLEATKRGYEEVKEG